MEGFVGSCWCVRTLSFLKQRRSNEDSSLCVIDALLKSSQCVSDQSRDGVALSPSEVQASRNSCKFERSSLPVVVYLEGVKEWSAEENLYLIGLTAWRQVKPFVSFFSCGFSVKIGTAIPCIIQSSFRKKCLVWHVMKGFPHEDMGVSFEKTNRVWLQVPTKSDALFQSLVTDLFGMHLFGTYCYSYSGLGGFNSRNFNVQYQPSRILHNVECEEGAVAFLGGLTRTPFEDCQWQQHISRIIIEPHDDEMDTACFAEEGRELATGASTGVSHMQGNGHKECEKEESELQLDIKIKTEQLGSGTWGPSKPQRASSVVKCPGCSESFSAKKDGLDALSHHIINCHGKQKVMFRHRLKGKLQVHGGVMGSCRASQ